jgi:hypothetical protein
LPAPGGPTIVTSRCPALAGTCIYRPPPADCTVIIGCEIARCQLVCTQPATFADASAVCAGWNGCLITFTTGGEAFCLAASVAESTPIWIGYAQGAGGVELSSVAGFSDVDCSATRAFVCEK